jgi:hypothetical protein
MYLTTLEINLIKNKHPDYVKHLEEAIGKPLNLIPYDRLSPAFHEYLEELKKQTPCTQ